MPIHPQPSTSTATPLRALYLSVEEQLHDRVARAVPYAWNEDFLSHSICEILRDRSPFVFLSHDGEIAETSVVFKKNSGALEHNVGDIGALFKITTKSGTSFAAWGYLEAKRRYTKTRRFDEIRREQLRLIEKNAPYALVLLYDFEDIRYNWDAAGEVLFEDRPQSRCVVVPMALALTLDTNTIDLYQSSTPLSYQLCYRYLQGLDLQPVREFAEIERFFRDPELIPGNLLEITVTHQSTEDNPMASGTTIPAEGGGGAAEAVPQVQQVYESYS